ncbi:hypothetical protein SNEBB_000170 [Seison nebaliae]|nr:hypothetical protein SNEBB_000170 [Seison nebaliae]
MDEKAMNYIDEAIEAGNNSQLWKDIKDSYQNKLWHQLMVLVKTLILGDLPKDFDYMKFYNNFLSSFDHRINPVVMMEIVAPVIKNFDEKGDNGDIFSFITGLKKKVKENSTAQIICDTMTLNGLIQKKRFSELKNTLPEIEDKLNDINGVTLAHTKFYETAASFYMSQGMHGEFYTSTLRYLGSVDIDILPEADKKIKAFNLCLAALVAENVYNFGEVLQHPILDSLKGTRHMWIVELLQAFNRGDREKCKELHEQWNKQPDLRSAESKLQQKLAIMILMEMVFERNHKGYHLTYDEVKDRTKLKTDNEIELLVMKAISYELIKGHIIQQDRLFYLNWVQPRVLDELQIAGIINHLTAWQSEVSDLITNIDTNAEEILTNS